MPVLPASAQDLPVATPPAQLRATTAAAISAESERKLRAAFESLYSMDFDGGLHLFQEAAEAEPESATACAFWSSALLYKILAHQGTLQSQLFVTTNEFLRHPRVPVDPELEKHFQGVTNNAEQRARKRLQKDANDADGLFALGLVYGNRANYLAGVKAEYLRGVRMGEKAYDYEKRLRVRHPEIHDAGVVLGIRHYIIGSLPGTARFFLFFVGARGNRERGLEYLHEAAGHGEFLRTYAQILLAVAWVREGQWERALAQLENFHARYPRNPIFLLELARLYRRLERYEPATHAAGELLVELTAHAHNPRVVGPEDALLEYGLIEAAQRQFDLALESLRRAAEVPGASKLTVAEAWLERGKIFDRQRERSQAVAEYNKVIALAADPDSVRQAKAYRKRPFQP
ncbi:MAG: tetratricopeptide repeat protein [Candidatus Acidiferrales bacterium]